MKPDIQYLLIGSGITLITSLVIAIVANIFQSMREEKSRLWRIEDDRKKEEIYLIKKRLDEAEKYTARLSNIASACYDYKVSILDIGEDALHNEDFLKFSKFTETKRSKSNILIFLRKEKINRKSFEAKLELSSKALADSGLRLESLHNEMMLLIKGFHSLSMLENEGVDKRIGEFFELISFEIKNRPAWMKNIEDMTPTKIETEKNRLMKFMFQSSSIYGEILKELDRVLVNYNYKD